MATQPSPNRSMQDILESIAALGNRIAKDRDFSFNVNHLFLDSHVVGEGFVDLGAQSTTEMPRGQSQDLEQRDGDGDYDNTLQSLNQDDDEYDPGRDYETQKLESEEWPSRTLDWLNGLGPHIVSHGYALIVTRVFYSRNHLDKFP